MNGDLTPRQHAIVRMVAEHKHANIVAIAEAITPQFKIKVFNPDITELQRQRYLTRIGRGKNISYKLSTWYRLLSEVPPNREPGALLQDIWRSIADTANILTHDERHHLEELTREYRANIAKMPSAIFRRELERLSLDQWARGEGEEAGDQELSGDEQTSTDSNMALRHKACLEYLQTDRTTGSMIDPSFIAKIYGILILGQSTKYLPLAKSTRYPALHTLPVNYVPLLQQVMERLCIEINARQCVFERAMLSRLLIAYLEPFEDGNKRTSRMVSNAILLGGRACPLSNRCTSQLDYRRAMIDFETGKGMTAYKKLFKEQMAFAVRNYFRSDLATPSKL